MQALKLVTFDATNTILKFRVPPWQYYALVARDYGFTGSDEALKTHMKESFELMNKQHPNFGHADVSWMYWWDQIIKLTFKDQLPASVDIDKISTKLIEEFGTSKCWSVAYGTPTLLELLKEKGMSLGVISNFDPRLNDILQSVKLRDYFDFVLTSYEVGYAKPDTKIFERALNYVNEKVEPWQALHVGDDLVKDYEGARKAGWHSLVIAPPGKTEIPSETEHVFTSINALYEAVYQNSIKL